jgi:hypothetical protein
MQKTTTTSTGGTITYTKTGLIHTAGPETKAKLAALLTKKPEPAKG